MEDVKDSEKTPYAPIGQGLTEVPGAVLCEVGANPPFTFLPVVGEEAP